MIKTITIALLCFGANAFASLGDNKSLMPSPADTLRMDHGQMPDGIYQLNADASVVPDKLEMLGDEIKIDHDQPIQIPSRTPFAVHIEGAIASVVPMIADEAMGTTPDRYEFKVEDLKRLNPQFLKSGDAQEMYSSFSQNQESVATAGMCKTFVERHFGFHVEGICASTMSAAKLARVGFHHSGCAGAQMQVWGGGRHGCGHVAYRTRGGGWSSTDFYGDPGSGYYSKGCYSRGRRI